MREDTQIVYYEKRIDALEDNIKELHSSELQFYSIFISALLVLIVVVSGGFVYFSNRSADKKHKQRQQKLKEQIESQRIEIDAAKKYIKEQKGYIDKMVKEQEFYHFEIFDTLYSYYINRIREKKDIADCDYLVFISCALLYAVIAIKNSNDEQYIVGFSSSIDMLIADYNAKLHYLHVKKQEIDDSSKKAIENNFKNSLNEILRINHPIIDKVKDSFNNIVTF